MQDVNERLIAAAIQGLEDEVNRYLDEGAAVNHVFRVADKQCTALGFAIDGNHAGVVKSLLSRGANCEIENIVRGRNNELLRANALTQAMKTLKPNLFNLLITEGANYYAFNYLAELTQLGSSPAIVSMTNTLAQKIAQDGGINSLNDYHNPEFRMAKRDMFNKRKQADLLTTIAPASPRTLRGTILPEREAVKRIGPRK